MPLGTYRKKRDFQRTPEPRGAAAKRRGRKLRFVIQKHAASRLHYDFRLELGGVLKSWAVPKGPSLDPEDKRLAVMVEDHPIEYGGFEGTIPKGQYGGGAVLLWDRGTWEPQGDAEAGLRNGHLAFTLHGRKLQGSFHLLRMSGDEGKNWLLVKRSDEWARSVGGGAIVEERPESVSSGRSIEEVAGAKRSRVWNSNRDPEPRAGAANTRAASTPKRAARATLDRASLPGARAAPMPEDPAPQLATLVPEAPEGTEWIHEVKYDGYRVLARFERGKVALITRGGLDWSDRFAPVAKALRGLPAKQAILDGEVAVVLEDGSTSFQALQNQLGAGNDDALAYFVFDLLYWDGYDLTQTPLERRKEALERLLRSADLDPVVRYSDHLEGQGRACHEEVCRRGLEGIVSKRRNATYTAGRTGSWLKVKCSSRQEFVIGGYTEPQGSRQGVGALLLGTNENGDGLRYRGRVGTGFTRETLDDLLRKLRPLETDRPPFADKPPQSRHVHWVEPRLVAEVSFGSWTNDGKLRHPSFVGLREDKPARDVVRESHDAAHRGGARPRKRPIREPLDTEASIEGLSLTHPDRVLYPEQGITKLELARYFHAVAPHLLAHAAGRPLMLRRCPEGREQCFYQKHPGRAVAPALGQVRIRERAATDTYLYLRDEEGLLSLVQAGVLEIHIWGARVDSLEQPNRVVFDFDPAPESPWKDVVLGATRVRQRLEALGLESFVKTTGGDGLHVVVPIRRGPGWDEVAEFSGALASAMAREDPDRFTTHLAKARRHGRVFIDTLRNRRGATWVCAYSPRAREGAPVSMPVSWDEVTPSMRPATFSIRRVLESAGRPRADAWAAIERTRQALTRSMLRDASRATE